MADYAVVAQVSKANGLVHLCCFCCCHKCRWDGAPMHWWKGSDSERFWPNFVV